MLPMTFIVLFTMDDDLFFGFYSRVHWNEYADCGRQSLYSSS